MAAGGRVSIPAGVRRTIADIKEIAGGHSDEEVYAMLRDCNMDPNETAQKLLLQDTFHEVTRKRDKKKEGNKELSDSRWRSAMQGLGVKSGRGNYPSRHLTNTTDPGGRGAISGKVHGVNQNTDKCSGSSPINPNMDTKTSTSMPCLDTKTSTSMPSSSGGLSNCPSQPFGPAAVVDKHSSAVGDISNSDSIAMVDPKVGPAAAEGVTALGPNVLQSLKPPASILGSSASASDAVLVPSSESYSLGDVGAAKQAIGSQRTSGEQRVVCHDLPTESKGSSSFGRSSGSRPSSSYSSRSQQSSGSQKVVPNKEWKPKPTSTTAAQATANVINPDDIPLTAETVPKSTPISNSISKDDLLKVDKRFDDLQLSDRPHVIIPDHLQISESEKYGLTFGSFITSFEQTMGSSNRECAKSSSPPEYESSQELDDIDDASMSRDQNSSCTVHEATDPDPQALPAGKLENHLPSEVENSSITPEIKDSSLCRDASATSGTGITQSSIVQTTLPYSTFGLPPQLLGNQTSLETSESQEQQPIDFSTSESYRPTADSDGHLSPFLSPEAAIKYENIPVLPAQTSQNQEGCNLTVLPSSGSAPLATPSAGVVPTSISVPQQSVPVFRQPVGVHLPHYPPNYIPYNQYISPFLIPPTTFHPFLGNTAFPQPPSTGAMYLAPGSAAVGPPVKYSTPSFKPGANSQASVGNPGAYGAYGSSPAVYTNNTTMANGNLAENDGVASSQFKENNIYIAGQQSEGSTIWIPALGRDISGLQASSFYGLPPQGQHVTFAPGQAGHGPFGGIYHPAQTVAGAAIHPLLQPSQTMAGAVELVGPPGSVYQQPQTQINWGNY